MALLHTLLHRSADGQPYIGDAPLALSIVFIIINTVILVVRTATRWRVKKGWDDYLVPPAYLGVLGLLITGLVQWKYGQLGYHTEYLEKTNPGALLVQGKCYYALLFINPIAVTLPKLAILCLYLRVFAIYKHVRIGSWIIIVYLVVICIVFTVIPIAQCSPIAKNWNPELPGHCIDLPVFWKCWTVLELAPDPPMLLLPITAIWKLNLQPSGKVGPIARKIGLTAIFCAGLIGTAMAIVRLVKFFTIDLFSDSSWNGATLYDFTAIEESFYFLSACLPGCAALLRPDKWRSYMERSGISLLLRSPRRGTGTGTGGETAGTAGRPQTRDRAPDTPLRQVRSPNQIRGDSWLLESGAGTATRGSVTRLPLHDARGSPTSGGRDRDEASSTDGDASDGKDVAPV